MIHFVKFHFIGLLNTLVSLAVIWVALSVLGLNPFLANAAGYVVGGVHSYLWNRLWNFRSRQPHGPEMLRFAVAFALGYGANLAALLVLQKLLHQWVGARALSWAVAFGVGPDYWAQMGAFVCYLLVSYGLLRGWVFAPAVHPVDKNAAVPERRM